MPGPKNRARRQVKAASKISGTKTGSAKSRLWRERNREKFNAYMREYQKTYRKLHPERVRKWARKIQRKSYLKNRQRHNAICYAYFLRNKEAIAARRREMYRRQVEALGKTVRKYRVKAGPAITQLEGGAEMRDNDQGKRLAICADHRASYEEKKQDRQVKRRRYKSGAYVALVHIKGGPPLRLGPYATDFSAQAALERKVRSLIGSNVLQPSIENWWAANHKYLHRLMEERRNVHRLRNHGVVQRGHVAHEHDEWSGSGRPDGPGAGGSSGTSRCGSPEDQGRAGGG